MRRHAGRGVDFKQHKAAVITQYHVNTAPSVGADGQSGFLNNGLNLFGYVLRHFGRAHIDGLVGEILVFKVIVSVRSLNFNDRESFETFAHI